MLFQQAKHNGVTYFLVRVAEKPVETRPGYFPIPRVENNKLGIEWCREDATSWIEERGALLKSDNILVPTTISHLRLAKSQDGFNIDYIHNLPSIFPEMDYEEYGVEDARITYLDDKYFITYVAVSRHGITTALASTEDFIEFEKHGIIFTTENKDVVLFPEKIGDQYFALHRPLSANPFGYPEIWLAQSSNLLSWGQHLPIISTKPKNRDNNILNVISVGAGCPPVKTKDGWLEIYHGSCKKDNKTQVGTYFVGAVLLDLNYPNKIIGIANEPILIPEVDYECKGFLNNIIFPTGLVQNGDDLLIYCGTADSYTAVIQVSLSDVLSRMT